MTREEIKELLPIMQAWAEGKIIQFRKKGTVQWVDLYEDDFRVSSAYHYRIKPEPKYRPFKSQDECWKEMIKHQPIGWIKNEFDNIFNIITIINDSIKVHECFTNYSTLCEGFKFMDGTPFGIKEE